MTFSHPLLSVFGSMEIQIMMMMMMMMMKQQQLPFLPVECPIICETETEWNSISTKAYLNGKDEKKRNMVSYISSQTVRLK
jgi:hypothetical protein